MSQLLFPTSYLPPIQWLASSIAESTIVLEVHETFPKQTIRNRSIIANASGVLSLIVPVKKPNGTHTKTIDICIDYSQAWQKVHWRSIEAAYNKSPYFLYYRDDFEKLIYTRYDNLVEFNHNLIDLIFNILKVNLKKEYTLEFQKDDILNGRKKLLSAKKTDFQIENSRQPRYMQVFEDKIGFIPGLSIIDLLFNLGPDALDYLQKLNSHSLSITK